MPHTLAYHPTLIDTLMSQQRMSAYQSVFCPADDVELMGAYLWNSHVVGALYPLVATVEVALRNAIDHALTQKLGRFWWDMPAANAPPTLAWARTSSSDVPRVVCAVRSNFAKATGKFIQSEHVRTGAPRNRISLDHDGIISRTEFSTWCYLLNPAFMGRGLIWPMLLGQVLAGKWPSSKASRTLDYARTLSHEVRAFRNRLFHHEPAWKRFGTTSERDAVAHLTDKVGKAKALLQLIHPELLRMLEVNGVIRAIERAATVDDIRRHQHLAAVERVETNPTLTTLLANCATNRALHFTADIPPLDAHTFVVTPRA